ncbi:MAG: hypothetical protein HYU03_07850 [Thaumarchaeota archaeon]|nr:hypothetical protein [Nitrososphaerota archaeon]
MTETTKQVADRLFNLYFPELQKLGSEDPAAAMDLWGQHNNKAARMVEALKNGHQTT